MSEVKAHNPIYSMMAKSFQVDAVVPLPSPPRRPEDNEIPDSSNVQNSAAGADISNPRTKIESRTAHLNLGKLLIFFEGVYGKLKKNCNGPVDLSVTAIKKKKKNRLPVALLKLNSIDSLVIQQINCLYILISLHPFT